MHRPFQQHTECCLLSIFRAQNCTKTNVLHRDVYDEKWHVANCRSPLQVTHRVINFHTRFRHGIPSHYIVRMFNPVWTRTSISEMTKSIHGSSSSSHQESKNNNQRIIRRSSKTKDRWWDIIPKLKHLTRTQRRKLQTQNRFFSSETKVKRT